MELLRPVIRPYAWGSRRGIAELQGRPFPAPGPEAELWMGAHPSAPSGANGTTLDAVIAADPDRELGAPCVARFGPRLPFLLKVLAADQALSIQVHPSRAQAQAGFRAENERGLAPDDPARNYVDDWPKPELLYALTPFEVLAGLRSPADAARFLRALEVGRLAPLAAQLETATSPQVLADALGTILSWPRPPRPAAPTRPPRPAARRRPAVPCRPVGARRRCGGRLRAAGRGWRPVLRRGRGGRAHRRGSSRRSRGGRLAAAAARRARTGTGRVPGGRRPARLPEGHRDRAARQLRQRDPGRPDRQAPGRPGAAGAARPVRRGADPGPAHADGRDRLVRHSGS